MIKDGIIIISESIKIINAGEIIIATKNKEKRVNEDSNTTSLHSLHELINWHELRRRKNIIINKNKIISQRFR